MPLYDYHCHACGHEFEIELPPPSPDDTPPRCPKCGARNTQKVLGAPTVIYRGRDWTKQAKEPDDAQHE